MFACEVCGGVIENSFAAIATTIPFLFGAMWCAVCRFWRKNDE